MTAPGNNILYFALTLSVFVSSGYAVGRIHQWHRHGLERDEAYRTGYDKASRSIIGMMHGQGPAGPGTAAPEFAGLSRTCRTTGHSVNQRQIYPVQHGVERPTTRASEGRS
ncbi:hypothetical protein [Actinoplanes sp. NPDC051851]|uniref:hypothetical protein n=1 Tax=Actinoplanes sp. NPDC051851 TaxID=3154753 RepID=UPI00341CEDD5